MSCIFFPLPAAESAWLGELELRVLVACVFFTDTEQESEMPNTKHMRRPKLPQALAMAMALALILALALQNAETTRA